MNKEFGDLVQQLRKAKDWTVKDFIGKLGAKISPSYMTKIEIHGEIPKAELICKMADLFGYDPRDLLDKAKEHKVSSFEKSLEEKYQKAVGMHRLEKDKSDARRK